MFGKSSKKNEPKSKRLGGGKKSSGGFFKRRKNQNLCRTPNGMDSITTPNVHDLPPRKDEDVEEEEVQHKKQPAKTKKQEWEDQFGGKYNYVCDIGAGAFGKVVKATSALPAEQQAAQPKASDTQNANKKIADTFYAIKLVDKIFSSNAKAKRFLREIRILRLLAQHEAIVELIDLIPPPNPLKFTKLCIVFEYMPTDLKKIFRSKQYFSNLHIEYILYQMLLGLKFVHTAGIVHRDLKPENIVYKDKNHEELVIIDFGDAKEVEEHSQHDDFVGTAFYLAPEAIRTREGWELKKSDMWTIGVIAYVLVTGRPPFWGRENKEIIRKIVRGNVRFPTTIKLSDECKDFILSLLQKPPDKRLSASEALKHAWITGESVNAMGEEVLENLATFGTSNQLKQLIVKTVAANLDRKHRKEYETQFLNLDLQNDEKLDFEELQAFLVKCGINASEAEVKAKRVIKHISGDENKPISKDDWNHSNVAKLLSSDHLIERQYKKLDVDEDGLISADDLLSIFEGLERDEIMEIIDEVDLDMDGTINFEEFRRAMMFKPAYTDQDEDELN
mmetsp:Transcript_55940/g.89032  ORF Transcript_55940/g.89032 Transcript_55940/m.89032 type:complete len:560 (-) Transcript_55940:714-2393(-)